MSRKRKHNSKILTQKSRLNRESLFLLMRRAGMYGGMLILCMWLVAWIWFGGVVHDSLRWVEHKMVAVSSDAGFSVENLLVEGRKHLESKSLMALLDIEKGDPLFLSDLDEMRAKIEALEWVKNVVIERRVPNDLYVRIVERTPIALLKNKGQALVLLDQEGHIIDVPLDARFKDFVIVSGQGVEQEAYDLMLHLYPYARILPMIDVAEWVGERRWDLRTKEGMRIQIPAEGVERTLSRLDQLHSESSILSQPLDLLDLRQEDRVIARPREGHVLEYNHVSPASGEISEGVLGYEL